MTHRAHALIGLVALLTGASGASGQAARTTNVLVSGGVTALTSESRALRVPGANVQLGVSRGVRSVVSSRVQLDVAYHSIEGIASPALPMPSSSVWTVTGSVVRDLGEVYGFRPYLVAGLGMISIDQGSGRESHLDIAGGGGIALPQIGRVRPFLEARYHRAMTGMPNGFIPLSLGLAF